MAESRPAVLLVRHGATEWSTAGRHTGRTDIPLNDSGRTHAAALAGRLGGVRLALVLCSPLLRALQTAQLAGYADRAEIDADLSEWHYGDFEGLTTKEIRGQRAGWELWRDGAPGGESPDDVGMRVDRVGARLLSAAGDVVVFAHGHLLRALAARWLGQPVAEGKLLALSAGSVSVLGWEREVPVLRLWNDTSHISTDPPLR